MVIGEYMVTYYSLTYLWVFLPVCMLLYQLMPQKYRWTVLLGSGFFYLWLLSRPMVLFLGFTVLSSYFAGLWMDKLHSRKKEALKEAQKEEKKEIKAAYQKKLRRVLVLGILANLSLLALLNYSMFFCDNMNILLEKLGLAFHLHVPSILRTFAPIGISFYTMEAMSYLIDVCRGTIGADRNLFRLATYMSFFPQTMEGPIARYSETASQLWEGKPIASRNLCRGSQRILFGFLKKMVIADHLEVIVKPLFENPGTDGGLIALAMVCYTLQLYMEFSGTMDVVIGSGEIFGVRLPENFQQPFFSRSISEFWMRWHITLGAWFRDYIFYPMSVSKKLKTLTSGIKAKFGVRAAAIVSGAAALFCVWICNGLWHGDGWQYIFFGMYHFVLILLGTIVEPRMAKLEEQGKLNRKTAAYRAMQLLRTFLLVNIGELFFRAPTLSQGIYMFKTMVTHFTLNGLKLSSLRLYSMDAAKVIMLFAVLGLIFYIHWLREKKVDVREAVAQKPLALRWAAYLGLILLIAVFGAYGAGYIPIAPIYAGF